MIYFSLFLYLIIIVILSYIKLPLSHLLKQVESRSQYTKKVPLKNIEVKRWIKSKQKILTKKNRLHSSKDLLSHQYYI